MELTFFKLPFFSFFKKKSDCVGCEDVYRSRLAVRSVLASVSQLLCLPVYRSTRHQVQIRPANLPRLLLVGHEQCHDQSTRLLLHECTVRTLAIVVQRQRHLSRLGREIE